MYPGRMPLVQTRMRIFFLLGLTVLVGCGDDNGKSHADLSASEDLSAGADDLAGASGDLAGGGGDGGLIVITDGGTSGAACTSACDCLPGLACFGGLEGRGLGHGEIKHPSADN